MTKTSAKKVGRPATGRDPTLTIRVPQEMLDTVQRMVEYMRSEHYTASDIWREAIRLGLQHIHGERAERGWHLPPLLRPEHAAEVHEAGHAIALFFCALDRGRDPAKEVAKVVLKQRQGGAMHYATTCTVNLTPGDHLRVVVAGAVAESLRRGLTFEGIWKEHGCSGDRRHAAKLIRQHDLNIQDAVDYVVGKFFRFEIWEGLVAVARNLEVNGSTSGADCWDVYKQAHDEALKRKPKVRGAKTMKWAVNDN